MTIFEERINRIAETAIGELKEIGIYPSKDIIAVKENRRAKKRLGCCKLEKRFGKEFYVIEISKVLETADDKAVKEVILHELLHTCKGCFNHGKLWKVYAKKVNLLLGHNIRTYADTSALNIEKNEKAKPKYEIKCAQCGHTGYRQKRSKVIMNPEAYRCAKCGGSLVVREI